MVKAVCGHQVRGSTQGEAPHQLCDDCIILATGYLCTPTYRCQVCSQWSDIQWQSVINHRDLLAKRRHDADVAKVHKIFSYWGDLVPRRDTDHPPPARGEKISEQTATTAVSAVANLYTASQPLQSDSESSVSAVDSFCVSERHLDFSDSSDSSNSPSTAMGKKSRSSKDVSAFDEALARLQNAYKQRQQHVVQPPAVRSTAAKRARDDSSESRRRNKKPRDDRRKVKAVSPASKVQADPTFASPPPVPRVKVEASSSTKKKRAASVSSTRAPTPPPVHTPRPRPQTSRCMSDSDSGDSNSSGEESVVDADSFLSSVDLSPVPQSSQPRESSPPPDGKDISFMSVLHMIRQFTEAELVEVEASPSEQWSSDTSAPFVALTTTKDTALAFNAWRSEFSKKDIKDGIRFGKIYRPSAMKPRVKPYRSGDGILTTDALSLSPTDYAWLAKAPDTIPLAWSDANGMEVLVRQMIRGG